MNAFLQRLLSWDFIAFRFVNQVFVNDWFDTVLPLLRIPVFWVPLYVFIGVYAWRNILPWRLAALWMVGFGATAGLCDTVSSHILKELIFRPRPCADRVWAADIRGLWVYCSSLSSFPSSHATNHFGMAAFVFWAGRAYFGAWRVLFWLWAFAISYAQVYVGLHYPLDILCGALVGTAIGGLLACAWRFLYFCRASAHGGTRIPFV